MDPHTDENETENPLDELELKKQSLQRKLSVVGNLELLINVITFKIFETQREHCQQMQELSLEKESLLSNDTLPCCKIAFEVAEIEKRMNNLRNVHEETMNSLEGQRTELRKECAMKTQDMDYTMAALKEQHDTILNELEASKSNADPSEIAEIDRRISELNRMYDNDIEILNNLQSVGWKEYDQQQRIAEILEERGLCVTPSGNFLMRSGRVLTKAEASYFGLLRGLNIDEWPHFIKKPTEVEPTITIASSTVTESSEESKMDSEDVEYLKTVFGKPLTLALSEITAKQPRDPIHYLGHWLFKYRYNQEISIAKKQEIQELINERERLETEKLNAMYEEEARAAVLNMIIRAEEEAIRRELERIAQEAMAADAEEDGFESEARDTLGEYNGPPTGN